MAGFFILVVDYAQPLPSSDREKASPYNVSAATPRDPTARYSPMIFTSTRLRLLPSNSP